MAKPNAFLQKIQAQVDRNMRLQRLFTIQQCEDMAIITLGQDFGFGEKRAAEFLEKFRETMKAYAELCLDDAKDDKHLDLTKGVIDRELERVMGSNFKPWEERYPKEVFEK